MSLKDPKSVEWKILYGVTGAIDVAQWLLDFTGIGDIASEFADPCIGIALGTYMQMRGVSMAAQPKRIVALIGGDLAEQLSVQVFPAWIMDVWYIHKTVREEGGNEQASLSENEEGQENQPANSGGVRRPQAAQKPLNQGGKRLPNGGI